jgi:hypothetical protein
MSWIVEVGEAWKRLVCFGRWILLLLCGFDGRLLIV